MPSEKKCVFNEKLSIESPFLKEANDEHVICPKCLLTLIIHHKRKSYH